MNVTCTAETCPIVLNSKCVFYESTALPYTAIATNDSLQVALQKIEAAIQDIVDAGGGGAVWGAITGTITNQSDLITYLSANYVPSSRTLTINGEVFDLSTDRSWSITTTSIGAVPVGGDITLLTNNAGYITTTAANTNYWKLTGTSLITGTTTIDGDGNDLDFTDFVNLQFIASGLYATEAPSVYLISPDLQLLNNASPTRAITLDTTGIRFILGSDAVGDIYYSIAGEYLARLAAAATGNALLSGTAPSWGKIGLTTHVSGVLPVANGGLNLSSISALSIPVANSANAYVTVTPGAGNSVRVNAGGTAWEAYTPGSSITNSAIANELMMSDGTNAVSSHIFTNVDADIELGDGTLGGTVREIVAKGSGSNVGIYIETKGLSDFNIGLNDFVTLNMDGTTGYMAYSNKLGFQAPSRLVHLREQSAGTNVVNYELRISTWSSGSPAAGLGAGMEFEVATTGGGSPNFEVGATVETVCTDVTASSEDFDLLFRTMSAGAAAAERLRITSDGRLYGTALHDNAGAVTGTTNQYIASGTYTPTITSISNVDATTSAICQWMRVGNVVTVSGVIEIDPTLTATATTVGISLPIASDFTTVTQLSGVLANYLENQNGSIAADTTNNRAAAGFISATTGSRAFSIHFTYLIV